MLPRSSCCAARRPSWRTWAVSSQQEYEVIPCRGFQGYPARILETRKTAPGMRVLDKWAVLIGGGVNHRIGLYDMVMIKNNHIAAAGGVQAAIRCCQVRLAHACGPPACLVLHASPLGARTRPWGLELASMQGARWPSASRMKTFASSCALA